MNAHSLFPPISPLAMLRALPAGPLAAEFAHLERARRLAPMFAALDRNDMELAVDLLLTELDARDGDPDLEPNGDEQDGSSHEEDMPGLRSTEYAAGCPIADPGEPEGDEEDGDGSEDDFIQHYLAGPGCPLGDSGVAEKASLDEDDEPDEIEAREAHRERIQRTRCEAFTVQGPDWSETTYWLRDVPPSHGGRS